MTKDEIRYRLLEIKRKHPMIYNKGRMSFQGDREEDMLKVLEWFIEKEEGKNKKSLEELLKN